MNSITKKTNGLIVTKAHCLLLDFILFQSFLPEDFKTAVYLLNCLTSISLDHNLFFEEFFKLYYNNFYYGYMEDLSYLYI